MKKLAATAAVALVPVAVCASATAASAKPVKVDVSNATITCGAVTGMAKFAPALTVGGTSPENTNVKLSVSDCTVSGVAGVTITSGKGAGVLHSASNNVANLLGPTAVTGHINIKWSSSSKLTSKESTVNVTVVTGGTDGSYASLAVAPGNASVSGDFAGTDAGASSTMYAETTDTTATLGTEAAGPKGLKKVTLGTDGTHLQGNSLTLG